MRGKRFLKMIFTHNFKGLNHSTGIERKKKFIELIK